MVELHAHGADGPPLASRTRCGALTASLRCDPGCHRVHVQLPSWPTFSQYNLFNFLLKSLAALQGFLPTLLEDVPVGVRQRARVLGGYGALATP